MMDSGSARLPNSVSLLLWQLQTPAIGRGALAARGMAALNRTERLPYTGA